MKRVKSEKSKFKVKICLVGYCHLNIDSSLSRYSKRITKVWNQQRTVVILANILVGSARFFLIKFVHLIRPLRPIILFKIKARKV